MQPTKIPWADFVCNPVKGVCPMGCWYCYARDIYKHWGIDPTIRFDEAELAKVVHRKKPTKIFWGSTMELFGEWVEDEWLERIIDVVWDTPQHTHIFLTKRPGRLSDWGFPNNCWTGVSIDGTGALRVHLRKLDGLFHANSRTKFISFEPLLGDCNEFSLMEIDWVIIGALSQGGRHTMPKREWVEDIINRADQQGIPVFMKPELHSLGLTMREEWPREEKP